MDRDEFLEELKLLGHKAAELGKAYFESQGKVIEIYKIEICPVGVRVQGRPGSFADIARFMESKTENVDEDLDLDVEDEEN